MSERAVWLSAETLAGQLAALGSTPPSPWGAWQSGAFVELLEDGVRVRLWDTLSFQDADGTLYVVPVNFVSDGSSHPRFTWSLFGGPLSGKYRRAAILHDYLLSRIGIDPTMTTARAHAVFRNAMRADGVPSDDAEVFFTAVVGASWWQAIAPAVNFVKAVVRWARRRW